MGDSVDSSSESGTIPGEQCSIHFGKLKSDYLVTPCDPVPHKFCRKCIEEWLTEYNDVSGLKNTTCPLCRTKITLDECKKPSEANPGPAERTSPGKPSQEESEDSTPAQDPDHHNALGPPPGEKPGQPASQPPKAVKPKPPRMSQKWNDAKKKREKLFQKWNAKEPWEVRKNRLGKTGHEVSDKRRLMERLV